jgi:hypothetical protein
MPGACLEFFLQHCCSLYIFAVLMPKKINWDALGITTSVLCAVHCALLPLLVASLPVLGINIIHNASFELGMIGLAFVIGTRALWRTSAGPSAPPSTRPSEPLCIGCPSDVRPSGFNRRLLPWLLFNSGIILLLAKQLWHQYELQILPFAVLLILSAHILNFRFCRTRPHAPSSSSPQNSRSPAVSDPSNPRFSRF